MVVELLISGVSIVAVTPGEIGRSLVLGRANPEVKLSVESVRKLRFLFPSPKAVSAATDKKAADRFALPVKVLLAELRLTRP